MSENIYNLLNVTPQQGIPPAAKHYAPQVETLDLEQVPQENRRPPMANRRQRPRNEKQKQSMRAEMAASKHSNRIASQKKQAKTSWEVEQDALADLETKVQRRGARKQPKGTARNSRSQPDQQRRRANDRLRQAGGSISQQSDRGNDSQEYAEPAPQRNPNARGRSSGGGATSDVWNGNQVVNTYAQEPNPGYDNSSYNNNSGTYGQSEMTFGSAPSRVSSNTYANGSNQNCGNIITDVSSTRRLAPPGGHSSFNVFAQEPDSRNVSNFLPHEQRRGGGPRSKINAAQDYSVENYAGQQQGYNNYNAPAPQQYGGGAGAVSSNVYANGSNQNVGNQITGRSTTRRLAPPGGVSNVKFY